MAKRSSNDKATKIATAGLLTVFGLVVFHAPLSVFFGQYTLSLAVKSWKEIVLLALSPLIVFIVIRARKFSYFSRNFMMRLIAVYATLHILLLLTFDTNTSQKLAGLAIDLRYVLFFVLVFCVVSLRPTIRKSFLKVGAWVAGLSASFATLQALVLPPDILKHIGYSKDTISPYLTVDKNSDFIRINGTLRGPNPLGAYIMILISLVTTLAARSHRLVIRHKTDFMLVLFVSLIILWSTYSRSAWLGAIVSLAVIFSVAYGRRLQPRYWLATGGVVLMIILAGFLVRDSAFVQNVVLHSDPNESSNFNSNEGHAVSLQDGLARFARQPLGGGIGSTGSASLLGDKSLIIENQYLFIAHESGWLGLSVFIAIFAIVLKRLYTNRSDWLNLGVFASGIGLAVIGLIQPVFVDDTVSLVWWGLAAIALASAGQRKILREKKSH